MYFINYLSGAVICDKLSPSLEGKGFSVLDSLQATLFTPKKPKITKAAPI
jgi:hypothetical protein